MDTVMNFFVRLSPKAGSYVPLHQHNCYELVYYKSGTGTMNLAGELLQFRPHTFTLTEPNHMHDEKHTQDTDLQFIGFTISDSTISLRNGVYHDDKEMTVGNLMNTIEHELQHKHPHYMLKMNTLSQLLVIGLERMGCGKMFAKPAPYSELHYIERYIEENSSRKIDLDSLGKLSGYSTDHFRHLFKQKTGFSPIQYQIRCRLNNAGTLLQESNMSISTIALECGFSSASQFCSLFKKMYGKTPQQHRNNR